MTNVININVFTLFKCIEKYLRHLYFKYIRHFKFFVVFIGFWNENIWLNV